MIVIVDDRETVNGGYTSWFGREGVSATGIAPTDFDNWVKTVCDRDMLAVEAFLLGDCQGAPALPRIIKGRSTAAVIAMNDNKSLEETLELFAAGVDDVVRKPIHVREMLARIKAIRSRQRAEAGQVPTSARSACSADGRDPEIRGRGAGRCRAASAASWSISSPTEDGA